MSDAMIGLVGVVLGAVIAGGVAFLHQHQAHRHRIVEARAERIYDRQCMVAAGVYRRLKDLAHAMPSALWPMGSQTPQKIWEELRVAILEFEGYFKRQEIWLDRVTASAIARIFPIALQIHEVFPECAEGATLEARRTADREIEALRGAFASAQNEIEKRFRSVLGTDA